MRDRWDFCSRAKGLDHHQRGERCWHKCNTSPLPGGWQHRDAGKRGRLQITFADRVNCKFLFHTRWRIWGNVERLHKRNRANNMLPPVDSRYATASTDTGHKISTDASWARTTPQKTGLRPSGHHAATVAAKNYHSILRESPGGVLRGMLKRRWTLYGGPAYPTTSMASSQAPHFVTQSQHARLNTKTVVEQENYIPAQSSSHLGCIAAHGYAGDGPRMLGVESACMQVQS